MIPGDNNFGVAPPANEKDRVRQGAILGYPIDLLPCEDATTLPCGECGVALNVGPKLRSLGIVTLCPLCATFLAQDVGEEVHVVQLRSDDAP